MKFNFSKEWCINMARKEGDFPVSAGIFSRDPVGDHLELRVVASEESGLVFGRFVELMRRRSGLTVERLAEKADVDLAEIVEIERDARHRPEPRTVYQLANYFRVPRNKLMQVAGLTVSRDNLLHDEAIKFAARSESVTELEPEERAALEAFVAILSKD